MLYWKDNIFADIKIIRNILIIWRFCIEVQNVKRKKKAGIEIWIHLFHG